MAELEIGPEKGPEFAGVFVNLANQMSGVDLDYSEASVRLVDDIIDGWHQEGQTSQTMQGTVLMAGAYLGEVMVRNRGATWIAGDSDELPENTPDEMRFPMMIKLGETFAVPTAKVAKRLENGDEDDLGYYYQVLIKHALDQQVDIPTSNRVASTEKSGFISRLFGKKG